MEIWPEELRHLWRKQARACPWLIERLDILEACGPAPSEFRAALEVQTLRARRAALEAYVSAAFTVGLFDGNSGADLRARLTDVDEDEYRGAKAECVACWYFAGKLGLAVAPRPRGNERSCLELLVGIPDGEICVEVKAPFRARARKSWSQVDSEADAKLLRAAVRTAEGQFRSDGRNLLFLVPELTKGVYQFRYSLVSAFYARLLPFVMRDLKTGEEMSEMKMGLYPDGPFLNRTHPDGKTLRDDGQPRYRRIGAVVAVEEYMPDPPVDPRALAVMDLTTLVAHNPNARIPIPRYLWGEEPQFPLPDGRALWTDGRGVMP